MAIEFTDGAGSGGIKGGSKKTIIIILVVLIAVSVLAYVLYKRKKKKDEEGKSKKISGLDLEDTLSKTPTPQNQSKLNSAETIKEMIKVYENVNDGKSIPNWVLERFNNYVKSGDYKRDYESGKTKLKGTAGAFLTVITQSANKQDPEIEKSIKPLFEFYHKLEKEDLVNTI